MSVIKCKECGGQVSTKATACPGCGAKMPKKTSVVTWLVLALIVIVAAASCGRDDPVTQPSATYSAANPESAAPAAPVAPEPNWVTGQYKDAMTDEVTHTLTATSENAVLFEFPYRVPGGSRLHINFRKSGNEMDAYFRVDKGQMQCNFSECNFSLRVGDGEVQRWTGLETSTNRNDMMFVRDAKQFQEIVKRGGKIRIGIEFYQQGTQAFEFDVSDYPGF